MERDADMATNLAETERSATKASRPAPHSVSAEAKSARIVILNQYYVPDVASTGHLLHELAEEFARLKKPVKVTTCFPSYGPPESWLPCLGHEVTNGVEVRRMRTTRYSKDRLAGRLLNSITFLVPLAVRQLFAKRKGNVYLYTSNPPYLGVIGGFVSLFRRHPYVVLLHDSYPHLAEWVGKIGNGGMASKIWHRLNRVMYRRALHTIVLCQKAKELVCRDYGIAPERVHVIPNWADPETLRPIAKEETKFAQANGLVEPFTILYSGNLGLYYEFESLLDAAERLQNENFRLVFIGSGGKKQYIADQVAKRNLKNVLMFPYQPFETLNDSLNACDASLVTIAKGIEGISFPSKLYSSLAVGKPIIAISEEGSELQDVVDRQRTGVWTKLGDIDGLVAAIRRLMADRALSHELGSNARSLMESRYTMQTSARAYADVLELAAEEGSR
jgi:glycosyltransferase involved in cell wall biosynthesis